MLKICTKQIGTKDDIIKRVGANTKKVAYKYVKQAYLKCAIQPNVVDPKATKQITKESKLVPSIN
jgi:hypothetical protein